MNPVLLKPENVRVRVISASKTHEVDSWEHGILGEMIDKAVNTHEDETFPSVLDMVRNIVNDPLIMPDQIGTIDPNIYVDVKGGGSRVVKNNTKEGNFRVTFDRPETSRSRKPSEQEREQFKAGEISLMLARYDISFRIEVCNMEEEQLAEVCGVSNW